MTSCRNLGQTLVEVFPELDYCLVFLGMEKTALQSEISEVFIKKLCFQYSFLDMKTKVTVESSVQQGKQKIQLMQANK